MRELKVDEKWSILYDPGKNDRPVCWLRYGEAMGPCDFNNPTLAMFYRLLENIPSSPFVLDKGDKHVYNARTN